MILKEATKETFGYSPKGLSPYSPRLILTVCEFSNEFGVVCRFSYLEFDYLLDKKQDKEKEDQKIKCICKTCSKEFGVVPSRIKKGEGKYCSRHCYAEAQKLSWKDPTFVAKMLKAQRVSPNKTERKMLSILERLAPGEWIFNGDFSAGVLIGRKIPDFVSVGSRKVVIEVFGAYFHDPMRNEDVKIDKTFSETINHYKRYGYKCIIVWEEDVREAFVKKLLKDKCII